MLGRELVHALQKKRPGIPLESLILHQDNAPPHTAQVITLEIDVIGFQTIRHPPYSPDLAQMDFAIFPGHIPIDVDIFCLLIVPNKR